MKYLKQNLNVKFLTQISSSLPVKSWSQLQQHWMPLFIIQKQFARQSITDSRWFILLFMASCKGIFDNMTLFIVLLWISHKRFLSALKTENVIVCCVRNVPKYNSLLWQKISNKKVDTVGGIIWECSYSKNINFGSLKIILLQWLLL